MREKERQNKIKYFFWEVIDFEVMLCIYDFFLRFFGMVKRYRVSSLSI